MSAREALPEGLGLLRLKRPRERVVELLGGVVHVVGDDERLSGRQVQVREVERQVLGIGMRNLEIQVQAHET